MLSPEEMAAKMASVKAASDEKEEPKAEDTTDSPITDKAVIEAALADMVEEPQTEVSQVHARICAILAEYKNEISSIPRGHEYWSLMNRYNGLRNP